ncbi:MAG: bile acid:sodium symporter family protein [Venatoribacter sp.]
MTFSIQRLFPWLAIIFSFLAWYEPTPLLGLGGLLVPLLTIVMFCMGLTLRFADFERIVRKPKPIALGVCLQFLLMPSLAWLLGTVLNLPAEQAVGLIIVGSCAGGTASNVMTYLAKGDVALSVSMTLTSTLLGVVLTPWLIQFYAGASIEIDLYSMVLSLGQIVLLPIVGGVLCNQYLPFIGRSLQPHLADLASGFIVLIIAIIVALNSEQISQLGALVVVAVMLHNLLGLGLGYGLAKLSGQTEVAARTIAIEVGMQNSGLGVALAFKFFSPAAAIPAALFSIWHNLSASVLAGYWSRKTEKKIAEVRKSN